MGWLTWQGAGMSEHVQTNNTINPPPSADPYMVQVMRNEKGDPLQEANAIAEELKKAHDGKDWIVCVVPCRRH